MADQSSWLAAANKQENDFKTFFAQSPHFNPYASLIKGVVCSVLIEEVEALMQKYVILTI
jgi:hypothetical protein